MKKKICNIVGIAFAAGFVIKSIADYASYSPTATSAPFYVGLVTNAVFLLLPSLVFFAAGVLLSRKGRKGEKTKRGDDMGLKNLLSKPIFSDSADEVASHCRRIDGVKTSQRVVALLFEDGPCFAPCEPERQNGESVFEAILSTLDRFGAKGTFAYVGSTVDNYPDDIGVDSEGLKYSHLPQYECDEQGGIFYHTKPVEALVIRGHEIVNHSCAHIPFGKQGLAKGRAYHGDMGAVLEDMAGFNAFVKANFAQKVKLCVPPEYITAIDKSVTAYDALTLLRMNILGYSIDCGGRDPREDGYAAEVKAVSDAVCRPLKEQGEDFFCGKILRLQDCFNKEGRSPVCDALPKILDALTIHGYKIVTASELIRLSPFSDIDSESPCYDDVLYLMARGRAVVYRDNTVRPDRAITRGEAAAMLAPMSAFLERLKVLAENPEAQSPLSDMPMSHPYQSAALWALSNTVLQMRGGKFYPSRTLSRVEFDTLIANSGGRTSPHDSDKVTRAEFMKYLVKAMKENERA